MRQARRPLLRGDGDQVHLPRPREHPLPINRFLPIGQRESGKAVARFKPGAAEGVETLNRLPDLAAVSARRSGQTKMTMPLTAFLNRAERWGVFIFILRGTRVRWPWPVWGFARARAGRRSVCSPGLSGVRCALNRAGSAPAEKAALASWLCERTTVSLRWLSARLDMGHYTNASRAPRKMNPGNLRPFHQAGAKLQLLDKNEATK